MKLSDAIDRLVEARDNLGDVDLMVMVSDHTFGAVYQFITTPDAVMVDWIDTDWQAPESDAEAEAAADARDGLETAHEIIDSQ
jgi:hypothetical protein